MPKNFVGEPINASENLGFRKNLCIRRAYHFSPLNPFCLKAPTQFLEKPFCVSEKLPYRKIFWSRGGGNDDSPLNFFLCQSTETFLGENFLCFRKNLSSKSFLLMRGGEGASRLSFEIVLSHSIETFLSVTLLCVGKLPLSKNITDRIGISRISVENFCPTVPKNFKGEPSNPSNFFG